MAKVFISYSRKDIAFAKQLTGELQKSKLDYWIDWEGIPPTVDWIREIEKGIEEADAFVFLISPDSSSSKICRHEIDHAVKNGKRLIPLVIRESEGDQVHPKLSPLNWIFFRESDNFEASITKLLESVHTDYEWVQAHRRLQVKALEWERNHKESSLLLRGKDLGDAELQLATNSSKEPYPTDLHREYILASRRATDRQRRGITSIAIVVAIALAILAVFGFVQAGLATERENIAQTAQANAITQANQRATAQSDAETNADEAINQAKIALSKQLAAQAQIMSARKDDKQPISLLLAIQSMRIFPSIEASQVLQNSTVAYPISQIKSQGSSILTAAFSQDGKYLVMGNYDSASVWDVVSGQEISRMAHDDRVNSVTFSPDGKYVISGSDDKTTRIWETLTGKETTRVVHNGKVDSVAISPDGKYVASGDSDHTIHIMETITGKEIGSLNLDTSVFIVAFSPDSRFLASGSSDYTARIWDVGTGKEISHLPHDGPIVSIEFSPDSRYLGTGSLDYTARIWDISSGKEITRVSHNDWVNSIAFSPDGNYVISGSDDFTARIWETISGKEITRITMNDQVYSVAFSPDGSFVVTGGQDKTARVWDSATGEEISQINHENSVRSIIISPDGNYVASLSGFEVKIWRPTNSSEIHHFLFDNGVYVLDLSPNDQFLLIEDFRNYASILDISSGKELIKLTHNDNIYDGKFSLNGKNLVTSSCENHVIENDIYYKCTQFIVRAWDISTGEEVARLTDNGETVSIALNSYGNYAALRDNDNDVHVWDVFNEKEIAKISLADNSVSVAISPDGKYLAANYSNHNVHLWDIQDETEISTITQVSSTTPMVFSPDGRHLALALQDDNLIVWDYATNTVISRMVNNDSINSIAFNSDGKYLVSGGDDRLVHVWDVLTGNELARLSHNYRVNFVAFSADSKFIVSGSDDNTTRVRIWRSEDLITEICTRLNRNLTRAEWEQFMGDILPYQAVCENLPIESELTATP